MHPLLCDKVEIDLGASTTGLWVGGNATVLTLQEPHTHGKPP